jgi:hypothetical protein
MCLYKSARLLLSLLFLLVVYSVLVSQVRVSTCKWVGRFVLKGTGFNLHVGRTLGDSE